MATLIEFIIEIGTVLEFVGKVIVGLVNLMHPGQLKEARAANSRFGRIVLTARFALLWLLLAGGLGWAMGWIILFES